MSVLTLLRFVVAYNSGNVLNLPSFVVHMVPISVNQFRDRHKGITHVFEGSDHTVQGQGCILGAVVAKDNAAGTQVFVVGDSVNDGIYAVVLPI